jgi:hypothetical protein
MKYFHSNLAGDFANPCKSFFLCSLRFLLLTDFPFKANGSLRCRSRRR